MTNSSSSFCNTGRGEAKTRPLDDVIRQAVANKRPMHKKTADSTSMDVWQTDSDASSMNPDDILVEMIRCGDYSQDQVVDFCIQLGIPLSRMLRLDLMNTGNSQTNAVNAGSAGHHSNADCAAHDP